MIAIGGVGGSGTRIFCAVFKALGVHMGSDLNRSEDNLSFTLLFKNVRAFERVSINRSRFLDRLRWRQFSSHLKGRDRPVGLGRLAAKMAYRDARKFGHDRGRGVDQGWTDERWRHFLRSVADSPTKVGFKEPNSHIYLPLMLDEEPDLRYIHIVRHGLDMAYSANRQQLVNWGVSFGLSRVARDQATPEAAFDFWFLANERVARLKREFGDRIMVVQFEQLCAKPLATVREMAAFAKIDAADADLESAAELVRTPEPLHRFADQDWSGFGDVEKRLAAFDYQVDVAA